MRAAGGKQGKNNRKGRGFSRGKKGRDMEVFAYGG